MDDRSNVSVRNLGSNPALKRLAQTTPAGVGRDSLGGPPKCGVRRGLPKQRSAVSCDNELAEYALNRNRHLFPTPEGWNDALWREHFITNRIRRLIYGGFWPPPIGWCTDLLSDGAYELPKEDLIESLNPPRPRLVCVNGERV
jgi:hypothetical protein